MEGCSHLVKNTFTWKRGWDLKDEISHSRADCHFLLKGNILQTQQIHPKNNVDSLLSGVPDYFGRNKISSGGDLSHYSSASLY